MIQEIFIIEDTKEIIDELKPHFRKKDLILRDINSLELLSDKLLDSPALILINEDNIKKAAIKKICKLIRDNDDNSSIPIIFLTSSDSLDYELEILQCGVEYYIKKPISSIALSHTIKNIVNLITINRGISPLTKLPRKYSYSI